jgi:hypothetical protein
MKMTSPQHHGARRRCAVGPRMQVDDVVVKEGRKATAPVTASEMEQVCCVQYLPFQKSNYSTNLQ